MAVKGNLRDVSIFDLLGLFAQNTGILRLANDHTRSNYVLDLRHGNLLAFHLERRPVTNLVRVQSYLVAAALFQHGRFAFEVCPPEKLRRQLQISLSHLMLEVARQTDEIASATTGSIPVNRIIRLTTRMEFRPDQASDYAFADFFRQAEDLLLTGVSADELARTLNISTLQAQFYIGRLAEMGVLEGGFAGEMSADPVHPRTSYPLTVKPRPLPKPPAGPPVKPIRPSQLQEKGSPVKSDPHKPPPILSHAQQQAWMAKQTTRITNLIKALIKKTN